MDAFVAGRDQLRNTLLIAAPASYKNRLVAQLVLAALLVFQCTLYLTIWVRNARRAGRHLNIFQLKRTRGGSMLTVQALCAYIICTLMCAIAMIADRIQSYRNYFHNVPARHDGIVDIISLSFGSLGCLAYTFSNFHSALLLRRGSGTALESTGRLWLIVYNVCFGVSTAAWIIAVIVIGVKLDPARDVLSIASRKLLALLESLIADPSLLTPDNIAKLTAYQGSLSAAGATAEKESRSLSILGWVYCGFYAVASIGSLTFVFRLRKHARVTRAALLPIRPAVSDIGMSTQGPNQGDSVPATSNQGAKGLSINRDSTALERLAADLTLSVPLVLVFCVYLLVAGIHAQNTRFETGWSWEEFRNDFFTWPELLIANPIVGYFLFNTWRAPGRYGASNNSGSGSGSARFHPSNDTHQLGPVQYTVTKHTELQSDGKHDGPVPINLDASDMELDMKRGNHWV